MCYDMSGRTEKAMAIFSRYLDFLRPFRLRSVMYLYVLVKSSPQKRNAPFDDIKAWFIEMLAVSRIHNGGGQNILFEQFQRDFGVLPS